jgi:hypothetical protein
MFGLLLQTFWAKNPCKKSADSTLDMVIYYIGTFYRAQQNLSLLHKIGRRSAEKNSPFFSTCVFYSSTKISMVTTTPRASEVTQKLGALKVIQTNTKRAQF